MNAQLDTIVRTHDGDLHSASAIADAHAPHARRLAQVTVSSPIGPLLLATSDIGVVRIAFATEGDNERIIAELVERLHPEQVQATPDTSTPAGQFAQLAADELDAYFAGTLTAFSTPIDHTLSRGFRREVREHLQTLPYGETTSYGGIATALNRPRAVRAVGTGCSGNPIPIIVPCHRVLRSDGSIGGYRGGAPAKVILLKLERDRVAARSHGA